MNRTVLISFSVRRPEMFLESRSMIGAINFFLKKKCCLSAECVCVHVSLAIYLSIYIHTHTHTHTHIYIYIYIYACSVASVVSNSL